MIWLLELVLAVLLISVVGRHLLKARSRFEERDSVTERRVSAYIATIRRERRNSELNAMSDTELRDLLLSGARNLRIASERKAWILLAVGGAALLSAIIVAEQEGIRGLAVALVVGAIVLYGLNEFLTRRMREPLIARGIDVERLKVE